MLRVFIGFDHRQFVSFNVLQQSIFRHSSKPVAITPLVINKEPYLNDLVKDQLPIKKQGLTPFTFSRFLVPSLCNYEGWALFLDSDILVRSDIAELFSLADDKYAVMVSKNKIEFEWSSVMLFNCAKCKMLTPNYIENFTSTKLLWINPEEVGNLPSEWNHLVGYDEKRPDAKLIHYTQGNPCFPETIDCEYAKDWHDEHRLLNSAVSWVELMGNSVHAMHLKYPDGSVKIIPKYKANEYQ